MVCCRRNVTADCWRFYPDAGAALARWGQQQVGFGLRAAGIVHRPYRNSGTSGNDLVAVFLAIAPELACHPQRMLERWSGAI